MSAENSQIMVATPLPFKKTRFTRRQDLWLDFWLGEANFNGSLAARLAGYSDKCASSMGAANLRNPRIAREIELRLAQMSLSKEQIKGRLGRMARGEIPTKTVCKSEGKFGPVTEETYDERQALEDAARIHGMLIDKHQIQPLLGLVIEDGDE